MELLHEDLTREIIGGAIEVHNRVGPGWDEEAYHIALLNVLRGRGLKVESKLKGKLWHRGILADEFELDLVVEDRVVLELKHLRAGFAGSHSTQLINYLKYWDRDLGMLINFGLDRLRYERIPFTPISHTIELRGRWQDIGNLNRESAENVRKSVGNILSEHGLGYGITTYEGLFCAECCAAGLSVSPSFALYKLSP